MKRKLSILLALWLCLLCVPCWAANVTTPNAKTSIVTVTLDAATAWTWAADVAAETVYIMRIMWLPNAASDVIEILDGAGGPVLFYSKAADDTDQRTVDFPRVLCAPVLNETTTTGANQRVTLFVWRP